MEDLEQGSDRFICPQVSQAFHRPMTNLRIGILQLSDQNLGCSFGRNAAITQESQRPQSPNPLRLRARFCLPDQRFHIVPGLGHAQGCEVDLDGPARTRRSLELNAVVINEFSRGVSLS